MKIVRNAPPSLVEVRKQLIIENHRSLVEDGVISSKDSLDQALLTEYPYELEILDKLLSNLIMQDVWKTVLNNKIKPEIFCDAITLYLLESKSSASKESKAPGEFEKWKKDVSDTAAKLADLIEGTDLDTVLQAFHFEIDRKLHLNNVFKVSSAKWLRVDNDVIETRNKALIEKEYLEKISEKFKPSLLSNVLHRISEEPELNSRPINYLVRKSFKPKRYLLKKPSAQQSQRKLFVAKLSNFLEERTGNPHRKTVASIVCVLFGLDKYDERSVRQDLQGVVAGE